MARPRLAAPTSAEAELLLLQRQALLEEEVAKTKRALLTRFMQEKLKREEQSSRWGLHKVRTLWRSAQRKAKDQELRQDIEILSQTFTRVMDCKDGTIETCRILRKSEEQTQRIRGDREHAYQKLQQLRAQVTQASATAHTHLVTLSSQCGATLKVLQQLVEKAQRLLRLAELCRRLETEEEKVLPFYPSSLGELEQQKARRVLEETASEPLARVMKDYIGLERFWQRFNKAKLEEKGLERARAALADRNQELRKLLQQYLAGATISQKVPKDPHPLLALKQKPHPRK